jgi:hypothetical protein
MIIPMQEPTKISVKKCTPNITLLIAINAAIKKISILSGLDGLNNKI